MPLNAVVIGKTLLVRQPIAQSLETLDFHVIEASQVSETPPIFQVSMPALVVMDVDGMAREWRMLAAGLSARTGGSALVLLASRFNFDDVHDAQGLHVAGVIVKPFRREEHTERLIDLALRQRQLKPKRSAPRFAVPKDTKAELRIGQAGRVELFPVTNIGEGGAKIMGESGWEPEQGGPPVTLSWGSVQLEASIELVHRQRDGAGIRFARIFDGAPKLGRALDERRARAFGPLGRKKRKW